MTNWVRDYLRRLGEDDSILHPIPPDVVHRLDQVLHRLEQEQVQIGPPAAESPNHTA